MSGATRRDPNESDDLVDRLRGALVGTAVGDALGAPMEGRTRVPEAYLDALTEDPPRLTHTDDTAMTLAVAESLLARNGFDGPHMARTLAERYRAEPWRGYGSGPPRVFARLASGDDWDRAAASLFGGEGSYGNGAAMRVAPVAAFAFPSLPEVARLARDTARITHTHPEGIDGAICQAVAVAAVLDGSWTEPADIVDAVRPHVQTAAFQDALEAVERSVGEGDAGGIGEALGTGVAARDSVPTALACFLIHGDSAERTVRTAISLGGDTDTIAAMAGSLAGARLGLSAFPHPWHEVEGSSALVELADAFAALHGDRS